VYDNGNGVLKDDLRIEDEDLDGIVFVRPEIDVDKNGNIYVLERKLHKIIKFDKGGRVLNTFSRLGEGPGDIGQFTFDIMVTLEGTVVVFDYSNSRITEFSNDGDYIHEVKLPPMTAGTDMANGQNGEWFFETSRMDIEDVRVTEYRVNKYTKRNNTLTSVDSLWVTSNAILENNVVRIPYHKNIVWAISPDGGLAIGRNDEYELNVYNPSMELIKTIARECPSIEIKESDKRRYAEKMRTDELKEAVMKMEYPSQKPIIAGLRYDHEGYLLVCLYDEDDTDTHYDVFNPDMSYFKKVMLPQLENMEVIRGGYIYYILKSEESAPRVCRANLVKS
jgi:hypothetical protein